MRHIRGQYIPGMPAPLKCAGIPEYYNCMEEEIAENCEVKDLRHFLEAIQHFGCDIQNPPAIELKVFSQSHLTRQRQHATLCF